MIAARVVVALIAGSLFGFGLALSGMIDPTRVQAFLDVMGAWNPSLAFVLAGAVLVATPAMFVVRRLRRPWLDSRFHLPTKTAIDAPLVIGAILFGIGWGMAGFCPGPAVAALGLALPSVLVFVAAMIAGMIIHDYLVAAKQTGTP